MNNAQTETIKKYRPLLRGLLEEMTDDQRLELISLLLEGYCPHCGASIGKGHCFCLRED